MCIRDSNMTKYKQQQYKRNSSYKEKQASQPTFSVEKMERLSNIVEDVIDAETDGPRWQSL